MLLHQLFFSFWFLQPLRTKKVLSLEVGRWLILKLKILTLERYLLKIKCFKYSGCSHERKKVYVTGAGAYGNLKIQSLCGSWEKRGFEKVAISRTVCLWECPLGELPLYQEVVRKKYLHLHSLLFKTAIGTGIWDGFKHKLRLTMYQQFSSTA